ncbi:MAG: AAA family ATPase [Nannocystaceae bacterium]|nr:AAA family ATPase [Nannocystaceae bacterium]
MSASELRLSTPQLRWRCQPQALGFRTTADVEAAQGIVGQMRAVEALRFGLEISAPGQNVYVRGLSGTGRLTLVRRVLEDVCPGVRQGPDYAYVHRFAQPDRPRLLRLPRGRGVNFRDRILELAEFVVSELQAAVETPASRAKRSALEAEANAVMALVSDPIEKELADKGLALVFTQSQGGTRPVVVPMLDGKPASAEMIEKAKEAGEITDEDLAAREEAADAARPQLEAALEKMAAIRLKLRDEMRDLGRAATAEVLDEFLVGVRKEFTGEDVKGFLDEVVREVSWRPPGKAEQKKALERALEVNLVISRQPDEAPPIIVENAPSVQSLVGLVDASFDGNGKGHADHMHVRVGALAMADGGVLVLEARELLSQPGAWQALVRTLRSGVVDFVPPESSTPWRAMPLKPDPIEVELKVVLLGEPGMYYMLDAKDADFPNLFKVLADFDDSLPRDDEGLKMYGAVLARLVKDEDLLHFDAPAVAELAEHGARIAAERDRLTARFGRLADLAREAAFLAQRSDASVVAREHVQEAVMRTKRRADGPARRRRGRIASGDIRIAVEGEAVGQVNGLAVLSAGPLTYGVPTRITATVAPGVGGTVNIERESQLSGAIHTKAFYILGGLLRRLVPVDFPLTFEASIAFEQSYGGIDGDSASGAEICCLLSALTQWPLRQSFAMTGAIDQVGNILVIGAVNEKIEGFFDTCQGRGNVSGCGVLIPRSNVGDLMLRHDVVQACDRGDFSVYAVDHVTDAIGLLFGREAGTLDDDGQYAEGTVLRRAVDRSRELLVQASHGLEQVGARGPGRRS